MRHPTTSFRRRFRIAVAMVPAVALAAFAFANTGTAAPAGSANLKITKSDSPDPVRVGATLTYSIGVENLGPAPASGVTVTDDLPKSVDLVSATGPGGPCAVQKQKVTCVVGSLNPIGVDYGGTGAAVTIVVVPRAAQARSATAPASRATRRTPSTPTTKQRRPRWYSGRSAAAASPHRSPAPPVTTSCSGPLAPT